MSPLDHFPIAGTASAAPAAEASPAPHPPVHVEIHNPVPPAPAPVPVPSRRPTGLELLLGLVLVFVLGYLGFEQFGRRLPGPSPTSSVALGRAYAGALALTYADAWDKAALDLVQGKKIADCQDDLQATWKAAREKAFREKVGNAIVAPLNEGDEPVDDSQRVAVARTWKEFAKGLRGGR